MYNKENEICFLYEPTLGAKNILQKMVNDINKF